MKNMKRMIAILMSVALASVLCACGGPEPKEVADSFMTALQKNDTKTIKTVYAGESIDLELAFEDESEDDSSSGGYSSTLEKIVGNKLSDFDYKLSDEKIDGDKASVKVEVTTYAFGDALEGFYQDYRDKVLKQVLAGASDKKIGEMSQGLLKKRLKAMKKNYTGTFTLHLTKKSDGWVIDKFKDDGDFYNVMTGGTIDALNKIEEMFNNTSE